MGIGFGFCLQAFVGHDNCITMLTINVLETHRASVITEPEQDNYEEFAGLASTSLE